MIPGVERTPVVSKSCEFVGSQMRVVQCLPMVLLPMVVVILLK